MKLLGICGSLRKESYNLKLLRALSEVAPPDVQLATRTLHGIPVFSEDDEAIAIPATVHALADDIKNADAIVFATPEYNYSIPGVLKNAIDWLSRHPSKPFAAKRAALMGASPGRLGTARAQYHLRQVGVFVDLRFLNKPEIMLAEAHTKFDASGSLTDVKTRELLEKMVQALKE